MRFKNKEINSGWFFATQLRGSLLILESKGITNSHYIELFMILYPKGNQNNSKSQDLIESMEE